MQSCARGMTSLVSRARETGHAVVAQTIGQGDRIVCSRRHRIDSFLQARQHLLHAQVVQPLGRNSGSQLCGLSAARWHTSRKNTSQEMTLSLIET